MSVNPDHNDDRDRDRDHDLDPANDNGPADNTAGGKAIAPKPAGGAVASLEQLQAMLNKVETASVAGLSGLPMNAVQTRRRRHLLVRAQARHSRGRQSLGH